ncbi:MAG: prepilin peptidase [Synechococcaceae cyanobacterium]|nr:prepilin peptidase [Synechococcaceae cyanobacterium]
MPPLPADAALVLFTVLMGASVGGFINVVVWRVPREESVVWPGSHCPRCGTPLGWLEKWPLVPWLVLRGRCRHCGVPIPFRYPLVELLCTGLWVAMLAARPDGFGPAPDPLLLLPAGWLLASWLLPLVLIDIDRLWLPEPLCRWGVVLGLAVTALVGLQQDPLTARRLLLEHLLAAAAGLLGLEALSALAEKAMGRPALGLGDAKLAALMGAWLGPRGLGLALILAVLSGALVGGVARLSGRLGPRQPFPFGPFLAAGALAVWIAGEGPWIGLLFRGL